MYGIQSRSVVIVGGGTSGWLAAAAFGKLLKSKVHVTLVESEDIGRVGVGEATIPPLRNFLHLLGIDEHDFMIKTQATFKLGIEFSNWGQQGDRYIHSFGASGKDCWACDFQHFWLRGKELGFGGDFGDYCTELKAAQAEKMMGGKNSPLNYAYHLDAGLLAGYLRDFSVGHGVEHIIGSMSGVQQRATDGNIESITLADGRKIAGDIFIDCTGFRAELIERTLNSGYERYDHYLPCDSAVAAQVTSTCTPKPYTESIAHNAGWQWRIPLQHRSGTGHVYSSQYISKNQALDTLLANTQGELLSDPKGFSYVTGRRKQPWLKNCIAMGLAAGFLEPLESTSIHLAMSAILRLIKLFPSDGDTAAASLRDEFNHQSQLEFERIRDFLILHYKATEREDSEFWRYCKHMDVPDELQHRLDLFKQSAVFPLKEYELFKIDSWVQVLLGQGVIPTSYHPIADVMSEEELNRFLTGLRTHTAAVVAKLPSHKTFIAHYCGLHRAAS